MVTTPSQDIVGNYGMGLMVYVSDDTGPLHVPGQTLERTLEDLIKLPFAQKVYIRPNWRDVQKHPGRLDFPEWWKITFDLARRYDKRIGFRGHAGESRLSRTRGCPDFLLNKVPYVKLKGEWKGNPAEMRYRKDNRVPRYDHPAYQAAFRELNGLLAAELNGHPQVEFMDTMMYGFWGEGHTWPFEGNPFPSNLVAEQTWAAMFETQLEHWTKSPAGHEHAARLQHRGQRRSARSHDPHRQLAAHRHDLHREHPDRGAQLPSTLGRCDLRSRLHHRRSARNFAPTKTELPTTSRSSPTRPMSASTICRSGAGTTSPPPTS